MKTAHKTLMPIFAVLAFAFALAACVTPPSDRQVPAWQPSPSPSPTPSRRAFEEGALQISADVTVSEDAIAQAPRE